MSGSWNSGAHHHLQDDHPVIYNWPQSAIIIGMRTRRLDYEGILWATVPLLWQAVLICVRVILITATHKDIHAFVGLTRQPLNTNKGPAYSGQVRKKGPTEKERGRERKGVGKEEKEHLLCWKNVEYRKKVNIGQKLCCKGIYAH